MNELQVGDNGNYSSLKEDPVLLLKLVDKHVKIDIIKHCCFLGIVHSFDPVTHSIILLVSEGDVFKPTFIPGHAILHITEVPSLSDIKPMRKQATIDSDEDLLTKKTKLIAWFKNNLLPVTESDHKIVLGNVMVLPPYNISDVCTDNPIVAMQIKKIMERMPEDSKPS